MIKTDRNDMQEYYIIEWICGFVLNGGKGKKSAELRELFGLDPVSLVIRKGRLRWFGYTERKFDDSTLEVSGTMAWKTWKSRGT